MKNDIHDLGLVIDSRVKLVLIESWDEPRVLETLTGLAVKRGLGLQTWSVSEGLQRCAGGAAPEDAAASQDPEAALRLIKADPQPTLYVACDLHPFLDDNPRLVRLFLAEKGVELPVEAVDIIAGANRQPAFLALNPMGKLPTLVHGDVVITEQVAITIYLADRFPAAKLAPKTTAPRNPVGSAMAFWSPPRWRKFWPRPWAVRPGSRLWPAACRATCCGAPWQPPWSSALPLPWGAC